MLTLIISIPMALAEEAESHMTWPDAFTLVGVVACVVAFFAIILR